MSGVKLAQHLSKRQQKRFDWIAFHSQFTNVKLLCPKKTLLIAGKLLGVLAQLLRTVDSVQCCI